MMLDVNMLGLCIEDWIVVKSDKSLVVAFQKMWGRRIVGNCEGQVFKYKVIDSRLHYFYSMDLFIYKYLIMMTDVSGLVAYPIRSIVYITVCNLDSISITASQAILCHVLGVRLFISWKELRLRVFQFDCVFELFQIVWFDALLFCTFNSDWLDFVCFGTLPLRFFGILKAIFAWLIDFCSPRLSV